MLNPKTKEYLQAEPSGRRDILKKHYLANRFGSSEQERALGHLGHLVEFTRRLNMVEGKDGSQQLPKPSVLRKTDLFVVVEICAESIRENTFPQKDTAFWRCWTVFQELLERVRSKEGSEKFFETTYLLFYVAALIFRRHIMDGAIEKEPEIFSLQGYTALATEFAPPLFDSIKSAEDQLEKLAVNLQSLVRA